MDPIQINLSVQELIAHSLAKGEGVLAKNGALTVVTGKRTGRSPKDRFIVKDSLTTNEIDWGAVNQPIANVHFEALWQRALDYLQDKPVYQSHLAVGADPAYQLPLTVITEYAWHQVFAYNQFIRTFQAGAPDKTWTLLSVPGFNTDPVRDSVNSEATVIINFSARKVLLCGMRYAGEMKKAMFTVLNFLLPPQGVLPMHCAANIGKKGDVALFFGLSGTGKTTLSADPARYLIGDDEHGWGEHGVFNFEGGCYAKCIKLSEANEPLIWQAIREGTVLENVVLNPTTQEPNYNDATLAENSRATYPLEYIPTRSLENRGGQPSAVIFLSCDLYGVLPPVAKLNAEQAIYYFLSGYTAVVGGTEVGVPIKPTFSTCFGAPFFPRPARVYAGLLRERLIATDCPVYLVNTGWSGGSPEQGGKRFPIPVTRAIIAAILNQELQHCEYTILPGFELAIPKHVTSVEARLLDPRLAWTERGAYEQAAHQLQTAFVENFKHPAYSTSG